MKQLSGKDFAKILEKHGWYLSRVKGSHHIYVNSKNNNIISLPIHGNKPLRPGILKGIMKLAGLSEEDM